MPKFQSRCRDWVVGEGKESAQIIVTSKFQSRCRDWVVGESPIGLDSPSIAQFQSRCRDWVVGELLGVWRCHFQFWKFQSRCRDWVVGESNTPGGGERPHGFSLVAEIGWLARSRACPMSSKSRLFQSRCRDWVVGENIGKVPSTFWSGFSLVAEIGWLARTSDLGQAKAASCFSLVAEIGWLARISNCRMDGTRSMFQSRCRDWVVGEPTKDTPCQRAH